MAEPDDPLARSDDPLAPTGERTLPGIPEENYWFQRHVAAYRFAAEQVRGMRVLDAGCGEGYGAAILAGTAAEVVGVDRDGGVVRHASSRYPGVSFEVGDLTAIPFPGRSFDVVAALQVIEHLERPREFLDECARVLKPGGLLILSTPNQLTFSPRGVRNPFHTFEFSPGELRAILEGRFTVRLMAGTFHGGRIAAVERVIRRALPERLLAQPAPEWPAWVRATVARVSPADFRIRDGALERSLDLLAVASR